MKKVFVLEDERFDSNDIKKAMKSISYEVVIAGNVSQANTIIATDGIETFDAIIFDCNMAARGLVDRDFISKAVLGNFTGIVWILDIIYPQYEEQLEDIDCYMYSHFVEDAKNDFYPTLEGIQIEQFERIKKIQKPNINEIINSLKEKQ